MDKPTLHLTNWSSRKLHGTGRKLTIMRKPNPAYGQLGDGNVPWLTPLLDDLERVQVAKAAHDAGDLLAERLAVEVVDYRRRCVERFSGFDLSPGHLFARVPGVVLVADGDTLCCACSRDAAARGECHRVWAADLLVAAGWRVVLDGVEVAGG